jgi:hypothetical protein
MEEICGYIRDYDIWLAYDITVVVIIFQDGIIYEFAKFLNLWYIARVIGWLIN